MHLLVDLLDQVICFNHERFCIIQSVLAFTDEPFVEVYLSLQLELLFIIWHKLLLKRP